MAWTKTQTEASNYGVSGSTVIAAFGSNPPTGSLICAGILFYDGTTTPPTVSIADGNSNAFTIESHNNGGTSMDLAGYISQGYLVAPSNANKTITVTFSKAYSGAAALFIANFTPPSGTPTYDNGAAASGIGTINTPSIPVAGSGELVWNVANDENTVRPLNDTTNWTEHADGDVGGFGAGVCWNLNRSSSLVPGWNGGGGYHFTSIGMSFSTGGGGGGPTLLRNRTASRGRQLLAA